MLEMGFYERREEIRQYFYPYNKKLNKLLWWSIVTIPILIGFIPLFIWAVLNLILLFKPFNKQAEKSYDECIVQDIDYLKERAVSVMGVVEEELSLVEPIIGSSFADKDCVRCAIEVEVKQSFLKKLVQSLFSVPIGIYQFLKSLLHANVMSEQIYIEGTDNVVRSSLRRVSFIAFTEEQIVAYECSYDVGLGIILDESVQEVFYRDVDCITYGDYLMHVWSWRNKKMIRTIVGKLALVVPSWDRIFAEMIGDTEILENQAVAVRALLRSKKQEQA